MTIEFVELDLAKDKQLTEKMLRVVFHALGPLPSEEECTPLVLAKKVVAAMVAADKIISATRMALNDELGPGKSINWWPDTAEFVASAYFAWTNELSLKDLPVPSIASNQLLGFAQGMTCCQMMGATLSMLDDDNDSMWLWAELGCDAALENVIKLDKA